MRNYFDWLADFEDKIEFNKSNVKNDIEENMFVQNSYMSGHSRTKLFVCKYSYKKGWVSCPRMYKVSYSNSSMSIEVFASVKDHSHNIDSGFVTNTNFHWTHKQEAIVIYHKYHYLSFIINTII